jgi:putative glycerol-1-phosphate prenyltransferase
MSRYSAYNILLDNKNQHLKSLAILIDPDKADEPVLESLIKKTKKNRPDLFLVGGSLIASGSLSDTVSYLKKHSDIPVVLFPGNSLHIEEEADGILFLSLVSGRNPDYLIGQHVTAAPILKKSQLEIISTGYILVNCGSQTTVSYISNTTPIPYNKPEIAACTAIASEMLGQKLIYLEGGSGADKHVSMKMIKAVSSSINIPLIVGGGIRSGKEAANCYHAGADILVVGTAIEDQQDLLQEICEARDAFNRHCKIKCVSGV